MSPPPKLSVVAVGNNLLDWIEEEGTNDGPGVRMVQAVTRNKPPDAWCASFVCACILIAFRGKLPFKMSGSCDELLRAMRAAGLERPAPVTPGVFFVMATPTDAHHVGLVTGVNTKTFMTCEGNTSRPPRPGEPPLTAQQLREGRVVGKRWRRLEPHKYVFCALPEIP